MKRDKEGGRLVLDAEEASMPKADAAHVRSNLIVYNAKNALVSNYKAATTPPPTAAAVAAAAAAAATAAAAAHRQAHGLELIRQQQSEKQQLWSPATTAAKGPVSAVVI